MIMPKSSLGMVIGNEAEGQRWFQCLITEKSFDWTSSETEGRPFDVIEVRSGVAQ